jgi:hypothetical protein
VFSFFRCHKAAKKTAAAEAKHTGGIYDSYEGEPEAAARKPAQKAAAAAAKPAAAAAASAAPAAEEKPTAFQFMIQDDQVAEKVSHTWTRTQRTD